MKRKGVATLAITLIVVVILLVAGGIWLSIRQKVASLTATLNNSEISGLVSYLKENSLQAAVIDKVYQPNNESVWIVKATGEKILLYAKDLGENGWGQPNYITAIYGGANGYVLSDQARISVHDYDFSSAPSIMDISSYIQGHTIDRSVPMVPEANFWYWSANGGGLSPDGKYEINLERGASVEINPQESGALEFLRLDKVVLKNGSTTYEPVTLLPGDEYMWSPHSKYVLLRSMETKAVLGAYDIDDATTTYLIDHSTGYAQVISADSMATGTFTLGNNQQLEIKGDTFVFSWMSLIATTSAMGFLDSNIPLSYGITLMGLIQ